MGSRRLTLFSVRRRWRHCCAFLAAELVLRDGKVVFDIHTKKLGHPDPLDYGATDEQWRVVSRHPPNVTSHFFCFFLNERCGRCTSSPVAPLPLYNASSLLLMRPTACMSSANVIRFKKNKIKVCCLASILPDLNVNLQ